MSTESKPPPALLRRRAMQFVILLGVVSLLSDMTYEGARSSMGPFLALLGASATAVGVAAGFAEFLGYALRFITGHLADRTKQYWLLTILGYSINLFAVPLLALAGNWQIAVGLMMAERIGKAIRSPAKDAMLSHAARQVGAGWGFGLHEAMDQTGAVLGPLVVAALVAIRGEYRVGFAVLLIPAALALATLLIARFSYPRPSELEPAARPLESKGLPRVFWLYLGIAALVAAGYADFPLIAFHFKTAAVASDAAIPLFYALAMGVDAVAALVFGRLFDRGGIPVLAIAVLLSAAFAPLVFLGGFGLALAGVALWGVGMGAQESIVRAAIADMVPAERRGAAYGTFNSAFGIAWFLGSATMGILYDLSVPLLVAFSVALQGSAVAGFLLLRRAARQPTGAGLAAS
ncbi:MAG: MFS transporter [Chloroflexi bacterium]|nr:MFS transporter [Chloroflexota bacterium]